jgi:cell shape-determining protein MreD
MAKKYEFRPDKPRTSLLSHLMPTKQQQKTLLKWSLYGLLLVVLSVVQDTLLSRVRLWGATTELVPCGIFLICILVGTQSGSLFSLIAGLLYLFSGTAPGPYSMVFITFLGIGVCMLRQAFLQPSFSAACLCSALAMLLYEGLNFAFGLVLGLTHLSRIGGFFITAVLSLLAIPILYPIFKAIGAIGGQSWKE